MRSIRSRILIILILPFFGSVYILHAQCVAEEDVYEFTYSGHKYEVIRSIKTWSDAATCAVERGGYLVEIGSQEEQDTIYRSITDWAAIPADYTSVMDGGGIAYVWIGATDRHSEGSWIWDGDGDSTGINFWNGQGVAGAGDGAPVDELYNHWGGSSSGSPNEPDDYGTGQDAAAIGLAKWPAGFEFTLGEASEWNDISADNELYFVVEHECVDIYHHIDIEAACKYHMTPDGAIWTTSGAYYDTVRTAGGCDSVYAEIFHIINVDTSVVQNQDMLTAGMTDAEYQWLDCNNDYAVIEGATERTFTPSLSGSYAVEITVSGCTDTSSCHLVITPVGTDRNFQYKATLSRGSGRDEFLLDLGKPCRDVEMQVCDLNGRIVYRNTCAESRVLRFELKEPPGIYLVTVRSDNRPLVLKLVR